MPASTSAVNTIAHAGPERVSPFASGLRRTRGPNGFEYRDELGQRVDAWRIGLEARPPATRRPVEMAVLDLIQASSDSNRLAIPRE